MGKVKEYLNEHRFSWAKTTINSEEARLNKYGHLLDKDPACAYAQLLPELKPYTIKTLFIRLSHYQKWRIAQGLDQAATYESFLKKHANKFKHVYDKKEINIDYDTALQRIQTIADHATREHAEFLLRSGLRISESAKVRDGQVVGKGGKTRPVFFDPPKTLVSPKKLRGALAKLGLKPHDLRKLCATRMARKGTDAATLCKVFGWSKIDTAYKYLQAQDNDTIKRLME